jgi:hypothetical protein
MRGVTILRALCLWTTATNHRFSATAQESSTCDSCLYDGNDGEDCKVYGQLGEGDLIAYHKASQDCLDAHDIKVQAVDATMLASMFPNADGSDANVNAFVSFLKNTDGAAVNAILSSLDFYFVEATAGQKPVFLDTIVVEGVTYDCTASTSDCWNAMKVYFESDEGQAVLQSVAMDLYAKAKNGRELEQSTVRIAICNHGDTDGTCAALSAQIDELKTANPDKACSAFGLGPAETAIPGCDDSDFDANGGDTGNSTTRDSTTSDAATTTFSSYVIGNGMLLLLLSLPLLGVFF